MTSNEACFSGQGLILNIRTLIGANERIAVAIQARV